MADASGTVQGAGAGLRAAPDPAGSRRPHGPVPPGDRLLGAHLLGLDGDRGNEVLEARYIDRVGGYLETWYVIDPNDAAPQWAEIGLSVPESIPGIRSASRVADGGGVLA
jgi:hypothetical protein